jgi:YMGG-like Gly-zipper
MSTKQYRGRSLVIGLILAVMAGAYVPALTQTKKKPVFHSVYANHVMRVRLNDDLDSEKAHIGDRFTATLVDPIHSKRGVLLAPQGSTINGRITNVQRAQKKGTPAALDVQFVSIELPNGLRRAINGSLTDLSTSTGTSDNEGQVTAHKTTHRKAKFIGGGAAGGAVIGAIAGGGKGFAIGAGVGALAGAITGRQKKGHEVKVKSGTEFGVIVNRNFSLPAYRPAG